MYACGTETMKREGPDPTDGSILGFYPNPEAGNYIIPQNTNNMTLNVAEVYKILEKEKSSQFTRQAFFSSSMLRALLQLKQQKRMSVKAMKTLG